MTKDDIELEQAKIVNLIKEEKFSEASKVEHHMYISLLFAIRDGQYLDSPKMLARLALGTRSIIYDRWGE